MTIRTNFSVRRPLSKSVVSAANFTRKRDVLSYFLNLNQSFTQTDNPEENFRIFCEKWDHLANHDLPFSSGEYASILYNLAKVLTESVPATIMKTRCLYHLRKHFNSWPEKKFGAKVFKG